VRYTLGAPDVSFQQLQELPTSPDTLKAWLTEAMKQRAITAYPNVASLGPVDGGAVLGRRGWIHHPERRVDRLPSE
jgi:hypothetical protein